MSGELLTAKELAHQLKIKVNVLYNWATVYNAPHHRVNNKIRFKKQEIVEWLKANQDRRDALKEKNVKYYSVRDKIKFLLADIVIAKIDIEELEKIYDFIAGLEKVKKIKRKKND